MHRGLLAYFWWVGIFVHNTAKYEKVNNSYRSTVNVKGQSNTSCKLQKVHINTILASFHRRIVHLMVHLVYFPFSFVRKLPSNLESLFCFCMIRITAYSLNRLFCHVMWYYKRSSLNNLQKKKICHHLFQNQYDFLQWNMKGYPSCSFP